MACGTVKNMHDYLDLKKIEADLLRIKIELEKALDSPANLNLIQRNGSVRGKRFHVLNTIRRMEMKNQWKKDYIAEEESKVVIYMTSCGVISKTKERCKDTVELLKAHNVRFEIKDLYMNNELMDEMIDRMGLSTEDRGFLLMSLPLVFVDGLYFGNHSTLIECNDDGQLADLLVEFKGRSKCSHCGDLGYTLCASCRGSKKSLKNFQNKSLRCAFCDQNGIVPCKNCFL
uniref:Glutaredoxin domain-containing protein n=1 Tax=Panagrolaimus sp. JU765 TaxID=591449 RepID=A0AC34RC91_9BILA